MRRFLRSMLPLTAALLLPWNAHAKLQVVTSTPDLAALAKEVAGDDAEISCLSDWRTDPHFVDPRPNLMLPLNRADLLIRNGMELEVGWLPPLLVGSRNPRIQPGQPGHLDASTVVHKLDRPTGKVDRAKGDLHPQGNPHYYMSPVEMARVARAIGQRMGRLLPERADALKTRSDAVAGELQAFAESEAKRFASLTAKQRQIVEYHASLIYLFDWLDLERVATLEPLPGISPNPSHVARVLSTMKARGARIIIQESHFPQRTSDTVAKLIGGTVITVPGATRFREGEGYLDHVKHVTRDLYSALAK